MKKLFILFVSVICILSACQRGPKPKDSLIAAGNAIKNCDANGVDKYVDISSILSNAIDVVSKEEIAGLNKEEREQLAAIKMLIIPMAKQYILEGIRELGNSEHKDYVNLIKVKKYEILENKDGIASARVIVNFEEAKKYALEKNMVPEEAKLYMDDTERTFVFKMKQSGEYWQITEVANLGELIEKAQSSESYLQAVEKSRATEALSLFNTINGAQQRYYLVKGYYTQAFGDLDLEFVDVNGKEVTGNIFKTKNFTVSLIGNSDNNTAAVKAVRNDKYQYELCKIYHSGEIQCGGINREEICPLLGDSVVVKDVTCEF